MAQKFLALVRGILTQIEAVVISTGPDFAGRIPALSADGRLDLSLMPPGVGAQTQTLDASEALAAGAFVNIWNDSGDASVRLADADLGRPADGFVLQATVLGEPAIVYPLDGLNAALSGLTPGAEYWLGTLGGVTDEPLDESDELNGNKVSQLLGKAKSETELMTSDSDYVVL